MKTIIDTYYTRLVTALIIAISATVFLHGQSYTGNLTLTTQTDIDTFQYKFVNGLITVEESSPGAINNLIGLSELESANGLFIQNNSSITNLDGLENLYGVSGDQMNVGYGIKIFNNALLENINGLSGFIFSGYARPYGFVDGEVTIQQNPSLTNINGLSNLFGCSDLFIKNNTALENFCGIFTLMAADVYYGDVPYFVPGVTEQVVISGNAANPTPQQIVNNGDCNPARDFISVLSKISDSSMVVTQGMGGAYFKFNQPMDSLHFWIRLCNVCPLKTVYLRRGTNNIQDLTKYFIPDTSGYIASGVIPNYDGFYNPIQFSASKFAKGEINLLVITEGHSKGELYGDVTYDKEVKLYASLDGSQEVPPVVTPASGEGYFLLSGDGDSLYYDVNAYNLSGPVAASHFHKAAFGVPGPPVKNISFQGDSVSTGYWTNMDTQPFTPAFVADLLGCFLYVNVHTQQNPAGEIRGQIYQRTDNDMPYMTAWGTRNDPNQDNFSKLTYYSLAEGANFENDEGEITGYNGKKNIESFTIDGGGNFFFLNNTWASFIYKLMPNQIDLKSSTPVKALQMGKVRTIDDKLVNISDIHFIKGKLYGLDRRTNKFYSINQFNAVADEIAVLNNLSAASAGFTSAADGNVYIIKNAQAGSELWKFDNFPSSSISLVTSIKSCSNLNALTAHPNGNLYAANSKNMYEININTRKVGILQDRQVNVSAMDFDFVSERYADVTSMLQFQDLSDITSTEDFTELPADFSLSQNYPNPFNPVTTIKYGLPAAAHVQLKIYNALGQLVASLINGSMNAGYHEYTFDASRLSSGIYLYKIEAGNFIKTNKMILLK